MIDTDARSPEPAVPQGPPARRGARPLVVLGVVVFLAMIAFWAWIFSGAPKATNRDRLEDRAWAEDAEETCAATRGRIDERTHEAGPRTPDERAADVHAATDDLEAMLDDLRSPLPDGDGDVDVVEPWLADWEQLLEDRRTYAEALRTDEDARFLTTEKFGDPLDRVVQTFAEVNDMPSCAPAADVG